MYTDISTALKKLAQAAPVPKGVFFKMGRGEYAEHDQFIGVSIPKLRAFAKDYFQIAKEDICSLMYSKINEERFLALIILVKRYESEPDDIYQFYIDHLKQVNNWNLVDASAHLVLGKHLYERDRSLLLNLVRSSNMWERRIAIVATWYFIKRDDLDWTLTLSKSLLFDTHDLIHKAVGWMLREVGKKDVEPLKEFLADHYQSMPRTMLRYAIEKFPEKQRQYYLSLR